MNFKIILTCCDICKLILLNISVRYPASYVWVFIFAVAICTVIIAIYAIYTLSENSYRLYLHNVKIAGFSVLFKLLIAIICTSVL